MPNYLQYQNQRYVFDRLREVIGDPIFLHDAGYAKELALGSFRMGWEKGFEITRKSGRAPKIEITIKIGGVPIEQTGYFDGDLGDRVTALCEKMGEFGYNIGADFYESSRDEEITKDELEQLFNTLLGHVSDYLSVSENTLYLAMFSKEDSMLQRFLNPPVNYN